MPYAADDLTPLLFPPVRNDFGFHQGKVVSWNPATGENQITMAGATLLDVPILNGTEVPLLAPGHVVGMLRFKSSYFILGRIVVPNAPDIGSLPGVLAGAGDTTLNFGVTTSETPYASAVFQVPEWANQALVLAVSNATVHNSSGSSAFVYNVATISGGWGGEPYVLVANGGYGHVGASTQYLLGIDSPDGLGDIITVTSSLRASVSLPSSPSNITTVHAIATFRRA